MAIDEPQPPYGLSYTSPGPPLFATPFITASNGAFNGNPFPLTFPPLNASPKHPNSSIDFSGFEPLAGMTAPPPSNTYPYNENYFLSIERQFGGNTVLSLSYVGSQAHHYCWCIRRTQVIPPCALLCRSRAPWLPAHPPADRSAKHHLLHCRGADHPRNAFRPGVGVRQRRLTTRASATRITMPSNCPSGTPRRT